MQYVTSRIQSASPQLPLIPGEHTGGDQRVGGGMGRNCFAHAAASHEYQTVGETGDDPGQPKRPMRDAECNGLDEQGRPAD